MQIKIHIKNTNDFAIPMSYNYQLMSAIYRLIRENDHLSEFIHNGGYRSGTAAFKLFCFSPLCGHFRINGKQIIFDDNISFEVRSPSLEFIDTLRFALFERGIIRLFDRDLEVKMIEYLDRRIDTDTMRIKTVAPIVLKQTAENHRTVYYSPEDSEFDELLNLNLYRKFTAAFGAEPPSTVDLTLASHPKKVVTRIKDTWITAYHGDFEMQAHPVVTQFLYDTGLGSRNSQGFGMFDILEG